MRYIVRGMDVLELDDAINGMNSLTGEDAKHTESYFGDDVLEMKFRKRILLLYIKAGTRQPCVIGNL